MRIPITFLDDAGNETADRIKGFPCIPVSYFYSSDLGNNEPIAASKIWAGIDTGADFVYADSALVNAHGSPAVQWSKVNGSEEKSSVHVGYIVFGNPPTTFRTHMVSRDFAGRCDPYRIMLGRYFFQFADLNFKPRDETGCFIDFDADAIRAKGHFLHPLA